MIKLRNEVRFAWLLLHKLTHKWQTMPQLLEAVWDDWEMKYGLYSAYSIAARLSKAKLLESRYSKGYRKMRMAAVSVWDVLVALNLDRETKRLDPASSIDWRIEQLLKSMYYQEDDSVELVSEEVEDRT